MWNSIIENLLPNSSIQQETCHRIPLHLRFRPARRGSNCFCWPVPLADSLRKQPKGKVTPMGAMPLKPLIPLGL
jgi:hypothetical protein